MKVKTVFETTAMITTTVEVPAHVVAEHTVDGEVDYIAIEDWAADRAHKMTSDEIETWGIYGDVLLDMSIDGIGGDVVDITTPVSRTTQTSGAAS